MKCAMPQYRKWVETYLNICQRIKEKNGKLLERMVFVGFCNIQQWPGEDDAWRRVKDLERAIG
jgi:hypothetical protein